LFAKNQNNICTPHSAAKNDAFQFEFKSHIKSFIDVNDPFIVDTETVDHCCQKLKRGKASDYDGLTAKHLHFAHPSLILIIVKLCNSIINSGYVPDGFGRGLSIPILKTSNKTVSANVDDFRLIKICPIISKVFEHCILSRIQPLLHSSARQFGFKKGIGCNHAIYIPKETIIFLLITSRMSASDFSKAFDKINHFGLFIKLIVRCLPASIVYLLSNWFSKSSTCIY